MSDEAPTHVEIPTQNPGEPEAEAPERSAREPKAAYSGAAPDGEIEYHEARLPPEPSDRVRRDPPALLTVHDQGERRSEAPGARTSTELAESSRRAQRRERARRAERTAISLVVGGLVALGGVGLAIVNSDWMSDPADSKVAIVETEPQDLIENPDAPKLRAVPDSQVRIPIIEGLMREGLTIVAEGLPRVTPLTPGPAILVGLESCRFAFAVWEFSPNDMFRYTTTCPQLRGQSMVGEYTIDGSTLVLSPLVAPEGQQIETRFIVEKPSRLETTVSIQPKRGAPIVFRVDQRVTVMRQGLHADAFVETYAPRNNLTVAGLDVLPSEREEPRAEAPERRAPARRAKAARPERRPEVEAQAEPSEADAPPTESGPPASGGRDPVLELLEKP